VGFGAGCHGVVTGGADEWRGGGRTGWNRLECVEVLAGVYGYAAQIYCDFSGYTDIALGVSLLFGLPLAENFKRPYLSRTVAEFW